MELTNFGGGSSGSGGNETPKNAINSKPVSQNIATQTTENNPVVNSNNTKTTKNNTTVTSPKPDPNAMFRPGTGGGNDGQNGIGSGPKSGNGFTTGTGDHGPSGIGFGTGSRGYAKIPDVTIKEEGKVYIRVHVQADGTVIDSKILTTAQYPTSISSSAIQNECLRRAKEAKYLPGKEEFRIIVFSPGN